MNWDFFCGSMWGLCAAGLYFWALAAWRRRNQCPLKTFYDDEE